MGGCLGYGHHNAQGLAYGVVGGTRRLYVSEHGPMGNDEIRDGRKLYLAVDSSAVTSGPSGEVGPEAGYQDCILEFTYQPEKKAAAKEAVIKQADRPRRQRKEGQ